MRMDIVTTLQTDFEFLKLIKKHGKTGKHIALENLLQRNKDNFFERYLYRLSYEEFVKSGKNKKHKLCKTYWGHNMPNKFKGKTKRVTQS